MTPNTVRLAYGMESGLCTSTPVSLPLNGQLVPSRDLMNGKQLLLASLTIQSNSVRHTVQNLRETVTQLQVCQASLSIEIVEWERRNELLGLSAVA